MRKLLDTLYNAAAWAAAFFMIGILLMVLASVAGRQFGFYLRGSDAYAGYCMVAASFLALAHTLRRGEHIRVTLFLERFGAKVRHRLELWCHAVATVFTAVLAFYSVRLAYQSFIFNDISQGNDATPLWIPQIGMALGAVILFIAIVDDFVLHLHGRYKPHPQAAEELKLIE
jgi:TRAP-type C4-dicarboxylate transport system permease small subunit